MTHRFARAVSCLLFVATAGFSQLPFGTGTPGTGGLPPILTSRGEAWMGNASFGFEITGGAPGAAAILGVSSAQAQFSVNGAQILLDPAALVLADALTLDAAGAAFYALPVALAPTASLAGSLFHSQVIVGDAAAAGGLAASRGLTNELSLPPLVFGWYGNPAPPMWSHLIDPTGPSIVHEGPLAASMLPIQGAVFGNGGRELFAISFDYRVWFTDPSVQPLNWQLLYTPPPSSFALKLGFDRTHRRLNVALNSGIVALDGDPSSPGFGQVLAQGMTPTSNLSASIAFSEDGTRAATILPLVTGPHASVSSVVVIDTDPQSPAYLQLLAQAVIPGGSGVFGALTNGINITPDASAALVTVLNGFSPGGLYVFDLATLGWVDMNPAMAGTTPIGPNSVPPVPELAAAHVNLSRDGTFATVVESQTWNLLRLDFASHGAGTTYSVANFLPAPLPNFARAQPSGDSRSIVVGHPRVFGAGATTGARIEFFDRGSGASQGSVVLTNANNAPFLAFP